MKLFALFIIIVAFFSKTSYAICGDGIIEPNNGEECDDFDTELGDGCDSSCHIEEGYECILEPSVCFESPCEGTCTLSRQFWETHNVLESDPTNAIPWPERCSPAGPEFNEFFNSGNTWLEIITMPSTGDACITAGRQWIASTLNFCNGACVTAPLITDIFNLSSILEEWCTPFGLEAGGNLTQQQARAEALELSSIANDFNNGDTGPGRCKSNGCGDNLDFDLSSSKYPENFMEEEACELVPMHNCTHILPNNMCQAFWGYYNGQPNELFIPPNNSTSTPNYFSSIIIPSNTPSFFPPGLQSVAFFNVRNCDDSPFTWFLGNNSATSLDQESCPVGCDGNPFSTTVNDDCGICGGNITNPDPTDCNENSIPDVCEIASGNLTDTDQDGIPDVCEPDCNQNGIPDHIDLSSGNSTDCNKNGQPDECDMFFGNSTDCNGNGQCDECDIVFGNSTDCNENWIPDECDIMFGNSTDCNENQVLDECDISSGSSTDCNQNGQPDECDMLMGNSTDCNQNGQCDECDIFFGNSTDCNQNGQPDECDMLMGNSTDCNENGQCDECDIFFGNSTDCNKNGNPDECDMFFGNSTDCNQNGQCDECDIVFGNSTDCNENWQPDECDLLLGNSTDCNENDQPDECDISSELSDDVNANQVPDECEVIGSCCANNNCLEPFSQDDCDGLSGTFSQSLDCSQMTECVPPETTESSEPPETTESVDPTDSITPTIAAAPTHPQEISSSEENNTTVILATFIPIGVIIVIGCLFILFLGTKKQRRNSLNKSQRKNK